MNQVHDDSMGELRKNWLWLMVVGGISVILGFVAMGMTFAVTMASVVLFGVFFLIGGFVQLVQVFKARGWRSFFLHVLIAPSYVVAGGVTCITVSLAARALSKGPVPEAS